MKYYRGYRGGGGRNIDLEVIVVSWDSGTLEHPLPLPVGWGL